MIALTIACVALWVAVICLVVLDVYQSRRLAEYEVLLLDLKLELDAVARGGEVLRGR